MKNNTLAGTFLVNITGAFLLGIVCATGLTGNLQVLLADGFLGAFTTFSTFMYEGVELIKEDKTKNALAYILISLIIGIIGYMFGVLIVRQLA